MRSACLGSEPFPTLMDQSQCHSRFLRKSCTKVIAEVLSVGPMTKRTGGLAVPTLVERADGFVGSHPKGLIIENRKRITVSRERMAKTGKDRRKGTFLWLAWMRIPAQVFAADQNSRIMVIQIIISITKMTLSYIHSVSYLARSA